MSESENLRALSRKGWLGAGALEEINAGSLQRIADATELMAKRHTELMAERDRYERYWRDEQTRREQLERTNAGLRGHITRLQKRLGGLTGEPTTPETTP